MLFQVVEMACHHLPVSLGAAEHNRAFNDCDDEARQPPGVYGPPGGLFLGGGVQVRLELQSHLVEALRQPPPEGVVRVAKGCAQVADDATALPPPSLPDHLPNRIEPQEQPPQGVIFAGRRQVLLDPLQVLAAILHVAVQYGEAEFLLTEEVMKERSG